MLLAVEGEDRARAEVRDAGAHFLLGTLAVDRGAADIGHRHQPVVHWLRLEYRFPRGGSAGSSPEPQHLRPDNPRKGTKMEIIQATEAHSENWADEVADLVWASGPTTYDYQFGGREYYDEIVKASWGTPGTLFSYDCTTIAVEGDELIAIEIGFRGPEFAQRKKTLPPLWAPLIESGRVTREKLAEIGRAAYLCSYLNVSIPSAVYYVHALAVQESRRGQGIGKQVDAEGARRREEFWPARSAPRRPLGYSRGRLLLLLGDGVPDRNGCAGTTPERNTHGNAYVTRLLGVESRRPRRADAQETGLVPCKLRGRAKQTIAVRRRLR